MSVDCEHERCEWDPATIRVKVCAACGMRFHYCDLCSWENEHSTEHAPPMCRDMYSDAEYEARLERARKRAAYE